MRAALLIIAIGIIATASGCAMPDYQLPRGFSSTYYRHLQQDQLTPIETVGEAKPHWWSKWTRY